MLMTTAEIIAAVADHGEIVSTAQLRRWRQIGLLQKAVVVGRGRGAGAERLYPADSVDRVLSILAQLARGLDLHEVGLTLWVVGFDYEDSVLRKWLTRVAADVEIVVGRMVSKGALNVAEDLVSGALRSRQSRSRFRVSSGDAPRIQRLTCAIETFVHALEFGADRLSEDTKDELLRFYGFSDTVASSVDLDLNGQLDIALRQILNVRDAVESACVNDLALARRLSRDLAWWVKFLGMIDEAHLPESMQILRRSANLAAYDSPFGILLLLSSVRRATETSDQDTLTNIVSIAETIEGLMLRLDSQSLASDAYLNEAET